MLNSPETAIAAEYHKNCKIYIWDILFPNGTELLNDYKKSLLSRIHNFIKFLLPTIQKNMKSRLRRNNYQPRILKLIKGNFTTVFKTSRKNELWFSEGDQEQIKMSGTIKRLYINMKEMISLKMAVLLIQTSKKWSLRLNHAGVPTFQQDA